MISNPVPTVLTKSQTTLHPSPRHTTPTATTLSITDSAVTPISGPEAIWFFDASASAPDLFSPASLTASLEATLAAYPFFAGRLHYIPFSATGDWTERQGRVRVVYGQENDPGIQLVFAESDASLASVIPEKSQRGRIWHSGGVPFPLFQGGEILMALHDGVDLGKEGEGNESLARVKVTHFVDGGVAIAAKIVHPIADAQTLADFLHYWAGEHKKLTAKSVNGVSNGFEKEIPIGNVEKEIDGTNESKTNGETNGASITPIVVKPYLDPAQFMAYAAGDINASTPDPAIIKLSRSLPIHRYDWWASADGCPPPFLWRTRTAPEIKASGIELPPLNNPIPWHDLDVTSPISSYNIQFSAQEINNMYKEASQPEVRISRLDALQAHIWTLIIRARNLPPNDEIFLNMIVNFRARLDPPLPTAFVGTPAILAYAKSEAGNTVGRAGLPALAKSLRSTVDSFNPTTIPNFLHDAAHGIETKRFWQTFIGKHHVTATSWLHHGIYDVDFGSGSSLRYAEPVMPPYLVCVTEGDDDAGQEAADGRKVWYSRGATVSIHFESKVVDRILQDPELRRFDY